MALKEHIKKDKFKWVLTFLCIAVIGVAIISLFTMLARQQTTTTLNTGSYHIGSINTTTGAIVDSKQNLYSDMFTTEDMTIEVAEDSQIIYKVVFYDENEDFVSATDSQSADFVNSNIPATAEYFRVLITPNLVDGENVQLNVFNMGKYADMLTITIAK